MIDNIDKAQQNLSTVYHSVPKSVMMNEKYLEAMSKFGPQVKHILDCPESNLPELARSSANFFTEKIKSVCPLMFPCSSVKDILQDQKD